MLRKMTLPKLMDNILINTDSNDNKNLLAISMKMFSGYGNEIADVLLNPDNDLSFEQKKIWLEQSLRVQNILENFLKLANVIIQTEKIENSQNLIPYKNAQWN